MQNLTAYGWTNKWEEIWSNLPPALFNRCQPGRVTLEHKRMYRVITKKGEWLATCAGSLQYNATERRDFPAVGDWVAIEQMPGEERGMIHHILPRKSLFSRKLAGTTIGEQLIAVNIDIAFIVLSMNQDFNLRRLERYLTAAYNSGATPVVVLSKADLSTQPNDYIQKAAQVAFGVPIITVSLVTGEGIDELTTLLTGKTGVFIGSSGVGKSSLLNTLTGQSNMTVQAIRADDAKGRHTTTHRELVILPCGGVLIDTPGMREFQLWDQTDNLDTSFVDIEQLAQQCKFNDCQHRTEPQCAVQSALQDGTLSQQRFQSYIKLQKELAYLEQKRQNTQKKVAKSKKK